MKRRNVTNSLPLDEKYTIRRKFIKLCGGIKPIVTLDFFDMVEHNLNRISPSVKRIKIKLKKSIKKK